jgi:hypothetical protein
MHSRASNLTQLLESDLTAAGYCPKSTGQPVTDDGYQVALESLRNSLLKKFIGEDDGTEERLRDSKALDLFLANNEDCRNWNYNPATEDLVRVAIGEAQATLDSFCHPNAGRGLVLTFNEIIKYLDVGSGANVGHTNVDFYSKVCASQLTATSEGLYDLYRTAIREDPVWNPSEVQREKELGHRIVSGSQITFALKNREISRTICTEPTLNMLFQKGIEKVLLKRLRVFFGIDLQVQQERNREMARIGSLDGRFATIDLKSASDRNSINMVKMFFPSTFTKWLDFARSPCAVTPSGVPVEMHMISSMGNAFTFPLQTILFSGIVAGCYRALGIPLQRPVYSDMSTNGNFAVFGDDIIVRTEAYDLVCTVLETIGHIVNRDKSFSKGLFRESCGSDWYSGRNVRGVYIKRLEDDCDLNSAINRLNAWSGKNGVLLENTIRYLIECLDKKYFVPMHEMETSGIRVPEHLVRNRFPRHEYGLQYKCLAIVTYKVDMQSKESFEKQISEARRGYLLSRGRRANPKEKYLAEKAWYNSDGVLLSALAGRLRLGSFSVREFGRRTKVKFRHSSCWDYIGTAAAERLYGEGIRLLTWLNVGDLEPKSPVAN